MSDSRKVVTSIVASIVVVGVVVGLVLTFAIIPLPDFPSLADEPDASIPGTVAFSRWDDGDFCVWTVPARGGEENLVICDSTIGFGDISPGWTPEGMLVVEQHGPNGELFEFVDPATGEIIDRVTFEEAGAEDGPVAGEPVAAADGTSVFIDGDRGAIQLIVQEAVGSERVVLEAEGPADYWFEWAEFSPDGNWILVQDSESRLIVVSTEGAPNARVLVADSQGWSSAAWYIEGYEAGTWDPHS